MYCTEEVKNNYIWAYFGADVYARFLTQGLNYVLANGKHCKQKIVSYLV